jgi:hypothetical protein
MTIKSSAFAGAGHKLERNLQPEFDRVNAVGEFMKNYAISNEQSQAETKLSTLKNYEIAMIISDGKSAEGKKSPLDEAKSLVVKVVEAASLFSPNFTAKGCPIHFLHQGYSGAFATKQKIEQHFMRVHMENSACTVADLIERLNWVTDAYAVNCTSNKKLLVFIVLDEILEEEREQSKQDCENHFEDWVKTKYIGREMFLGNTFGSLAQYITLQFVINSSEKKTIDFYRKKITAIKKESTVPIYMIAPYRNSPLFSMKEKQTSPVQGEALLAMLLGSISSGYESYYKEEDGEMFDLIVSDELSDQDEMTDQILPEEMTDRILPSYEQGKNSPKDTKCKCLCLIS